MRTESRPSPKQKPFFSSLLGVRFKADRDKSTKQWRAPHASRDADWSALAGEASGVVGGAKRQAG
jgi:hypothetical protein